MGIVDYGYCLMDNESLDLFKCDEMMSALSCCGCFKILKNGERIAHVDKAGLWVQNKNLGIFCSFSDVIKVLESN